MMNKLKTFWQFSRPHTIIGSALSVAAVFFIAKAAGGAVFISWKLLPTSLLAALACNVFITGLNQWADVEVDKINKPWLPIAAGLLSKRDALRIVLACGLLSLAAAACLSWRFFGLILTILLIGAAYSLPPLKFKRSHVLAAAAISIVRGLLVNLGFFAHFRHEMTGDGSLLPAIWPLTVFVAAFSLGIAWFKDIPDTRGDAAFDFGTLAVLRGRRRALGTGVLAVSFAYAFIVFSAVLGKLPAPLFFGVSHGAALLAFLWKARRLDVDDDAAVKRFYLFFWGLFFLEYLVYPLGFYL